MTSASVPSNLLGVRQTFPPSFSPFLLIFSVSMSCWRSNICQMLMSLVLTLSPPHVANTPLLESPETEYSNCCLSCDEITAYSVWSKRICIDQRQVYSRKTTELGKQFSYRKTWKLSKEHDYRLFRLFRQFCYRSFCDLYKFKFRIFNIFEGKVNVTTQPYFYCDRYCDNLYLSKITSWIQVIKS